ncbi:MAG TPA: M64 family metallopeptidase, partial [Steroidobacteraceae bacterium]
MTFESSARLGARALLCLLTGILAGCGGGGGSSGSPAPSPPSASNTAPVATAASLSTAEDSVLQGVLAAQDAEGNSLSFAIAAQPAHGVAQVDGRTGAFTYTPGPDFSGADEFTFTASDGHARSTPAAVSITVNPVDDPFDIRKLEAPLGGEAGQLLSVVLQLGDPEDLAEIEVTAQDGAAVQDLARRMDGFEFRLPQASESHASMFKLRVRDPQGEVIEREFSTHIWPVSASGHLTTLIGGLHSPGLHWVIVGDGFQANERAALLQKARAAIEGVMTEPRLQAHNAIWNVHVLSVASAESGADIPSSGISRDTAFDATFGCAGIERLMCADFGKVYAQLLPEIQTIDTLLVLVNSTYYGGSGSSSGAIVSLHPTASQTILHEMGHTFAGLADEYVDSAMEAPRTNGYVEGSYPNITRLTDASRIPWRHWFVDPDDIPTTDGAEGIGRFEGGFYALRGFYRPTYESFMRTTGGAVNAVHTEAWIRHIYQDVPPIIGSVPARGSIRLAPGQRRTFGILRPYPRGVQRVRWYLDGQEVVSGRDFDQLACCTGISGAHVLRVHVTDITGLIRAPDAIEGMDSRTWNLAIDGSLGVPRIDLSASPGAVVPGASAMLTWQATDATGCVASGGWQGSRAISGTEATGALSASTIYRLACSGAGGTTEELLQVLVAPAGDAPVASLVATQDAVTAGEPVQLYWTSYRAASCTASDGWTGTLAPEGRQTLDAIIATTQYTLTCTGPGGTAQSTVSVRVRGNAPMLDLTAAPQTVFAGKAALLDWTATHAASCEAFGAWSGAREVAGSESVIPTGTSATYRLDCVGPEGSVTESVMVQVDGEPPPEESPVTLITTEFVEMNGRESHQGLVAVSRAPIAGTSPRLRLVLGGDLETDPVLSLIDTQGAQISALSLPLQRASGGAREYLGNITLPAAAFRVRARGTDAQGRAYDLMSESFVATRFEARLPFGRIPVRGGQAVAIPLIVKNHGGAGQFELDVTLSAGLILHS